MSGTYGNMWIHCYHREVIPMWPTQFGHNNRSIATEFAGSVYGYQLEPKVLKSLVYVNFAIPHNWDGTSNGVWRLFWFQNEEGSEKDGTVIFDWHWSVAEDWGVPIATNIVQQSATIVYGDEGTSDFCMHSGTFDMDWTGGTFGQLKPGMLVFGRLSQGKSVDAGTLTHGSAVLYRTQLEYMATHFGDEFVKRDTWDKRDS